MAKTQAETQAERWTLMPALMRGVLRLFVAALPDARESLVTKPDRIEAPRQR